MTPEGRQRIYRAFEAALSCDPAARAELLARLKACDPELGTEVERLLAQDAEAEQNRFLAFPAATATHQERPAKAGSAGGEATFSWSQSSEKTGAGNAGTEDAPPAALVEHPDYVIKRELARGGMGVVYLAENRLLGRDEVLKMIGQHILERPGTVERFLREIRAVARLRHPNIVTAYHATRLGKSIVFAMEYVEGLDLSRMVKARGPLPVANACNYIYQAALGLEHAHEQGLVHRDIKPSNLMLTRQGNRAMIKVLDFGLAKVKSETPTDWTLTYEGQMVGSPNFVAPEQITDAVRADIRADIYSLGCTLYYLLSGRPPFEGKSLYETLRAHHSVEPTPLNVARPEVPAELAALVAKMMAKDPNRRFQTPKDVAQALKPYFKSGSDRLAVGQPPFDAGTGEPVVEMMLEDAETTHRTPFWLWPLLASAVLLAGLFGAWNFRNLFDRSGAIEPGKAGAPPLDTQRSAPRPKAAIAERRSHELARPSLKTGGAPRTEQVAKGSKVIPGATQATSIPPPGSRLAPGAPSAPAAQPHALGGGMSLAETHDQTTSRPPTDGFVLLFNGRDLTGWAFHPAHAASPWGVEDGMIVGRGPRRGHLYTSSDDYSNFHARIDAIVNAGGSAGFCFRVPPIVNGQLEGSGREVSIDASSSDAKTGSLLDFGQTSRIQTALTRANEWFVLEVLAVGRRILVKVNGQKTADVYDRSNRYNRGHFALHQTGDSTEVKVRRVEVRRIDLGNDPSAIAGGAQPRPVAARVFNGKKYLAFGEVLSWNEARNRCRDLGGRLALPINQEENRFLTTLAQDTGIAGAWLGASDQNLAEQWFSVDGSELKYDNWDPDLVGPIDAFSKQHYPVLLVSREGKWAYQPNVSGQYRPGYICQWD